MEFKELRSLLIADRTVRRFKEEREVSLEKLEELVELTRYSASGRNAQPLRYVIVTDKEMRERIYPLLKWAGYYEDWDGPEEGERPAAYIIQCLDTKYGNNCLCDDGLQLQAITLGMTTLGLGGCIIKSFNNVALPQILQLKERFVPRYVLALGYPEERVRLEEMSGGEDADFRYHRSPDRVQIVPKRPLSELLIQKF